MGDWAGQNESFNMGDAWKLWLFEANLQWSFKNCIICTFRFVSSLGTGGRGLVSDIIVLVVV